MAIFKFANCNSHYQCLCLSWQMTITTEINKDLFGRSLWARTDCCSEWIGLAMNL